MGGGGRWRQGWYSRGVVAALGAAALFGVSTPLAKQLLTNFSPWMLAGLLYLGSGLGLTLWRVVTGAPRVRPVTSEWWALAGAIGAGGLCAPILLLSGLLGMPASGAALLLNAEGVLTALLAWFVFRENFDRRIALGMALIVVGAAVLSFDARVEFRNGYSALLVIAACLAWAVDNNFTRKLALLDPTWLAAVKGVVAGTTNLAVAVAMGASTSGGRALGGVAGSHWPTAEIVAGALGVGAIGYGASLAMFVVALRYLGAARTSAYFSVAPFVGAVFAIVWLREPVSGQFLIASALMALGVGLHLSERHSHNHVHPLLEHEHEHEHDEHHQHEHSQPVSAGTRHSHRHRHEPLEHAHEHFPDAHHRHDH